MSPAFSDVDPSLAELILRCTPPRPTRHLLARPRLRLTDGRLADASVVVLHAPPGFGKSSLLTQWRQETLEHGDAVAWVAAERSLTVRRLAAALALSVRVGCARPGFGAFLVSGAGLFATSHELMTSWLAEIALTPLRIVLMVDEAADLSVDGLAALAYLMHNTPANLRIVVASRRPLDAEVADLVGYGACTVLDTNALRFQFDESLALLRERPGARIDEGTAARLHECADGWPQGLRLALGALERGVDPRKLLDAGDGHGPDEAIFEPLCSGLCESDVEFLTRTAHCEMLHPRLCQALTGDAAAADKLTNLARSTPFFLMLDDSGWCRCNALARQTFVTRFARLPPREQVGLHERAMEWFMREGMVERAAHHARCAGLRERAYDLAERCFYDAVMQGRVAAMLDWLDQLPPDELARRPRLRMAAAWALALGERHAQAEALIQDILAYSHDDPGLGYECALIRSGAALFADEPDTFVRLMQPWIDAAPPTREARLLQMHANRLAMIDLLHGMPARARRHQADAPRGQFGIGQHYALLWGELITALSYVWTGQMRLAEPMLRGSLEACDSEFGRRHPLACMLAALLALVLYESDRIDEAATMQADRLDVLERSGFPDALLLGLRTAVRVAAAQGREHHALAIAEALEAAGAARGLPRLSLAGIGEQIRLHAAHGRVQTCRSLQARIDVIMSTADGSAKPLWRRAAAVLAQAARAHVAIAECRWNDAERMLVEAQAAAVAQGATRLQVVAMALRAFVAEQSGENGNALLDEAVGLAQTYGLHRSLLDSHPGVAAAIERLHPRGDVQPPGAPARASGAEASARSQVAGSVLTPKERAILELLARNLSNKEVARALGVGETTVKWHLKNLFAKLDAGSRRQVVVRARVLGFLGTDD